MKGLLGICVLVAIASSTSDMTLEEKRVENAMFAMVGEQPPHDVPLDQKESLHDMLVSRQKAANAAKAADPKNHSDHSEHHKGHSAHGAHVGHKNDVPKDEHKGHMDHAHMSHTGHGNHEGHTMMMFFHGGSKEVILFDFWRIESCTGLLVSCVIIFVMGAMYEGLKWFRVYLTLFKKEKEPEMLPSTVTETHCKSRTENNNADVPLVSANSRSTTPEAKHPGPFSFVRLSQTLLYIVQLVVAYWLMLIVMTYNIWLTIAVILGAGFGHWLFAALRFANPDGEAADQIATDACH